MTTQRTLAETVQLRVGQVNTNPHQTALHTFVTFIPLKHLFRKRDSKITFKTSLENFLSELRCAVRTFSLLSPQAGDRQKGWSIAHEAASSQNLLQRRFLETAPHQDTRVQSWVKTGLPRAAAFTPENGWEDTITRTPSCIYSHREVRIGTNNKHRFKYK